MNLTLLSKRNLFFSVLVFLVGTHGAFSHPTSDWAPLIRSPQGFILDRQTSGGVPLPIRWANRQIVISNPQAIDQLKAAIPLDRIHAIYRELPQRELILRSRKMQWNGSVFKTFFYDGTIVTAKMEGSSALLEVFSSTVYNEDKGTFVNIRDKTNWWFHNCSGELGSLAR